MIDKKIKNVFILILTIAIFSYFKNIFLGRVLDREMLGYFAIANNIIGFTVPLLLFGLPSSLSRYLSNNRIQEYAWPKILFKHSIIMIILAAGIGLLSRQVYEFDHVTLVFVVLGVGSFTITILFSTIVRIYGQYELSIIYQRMDRILFSISVILLYFVYHFSYHMILWIGSVIFFITASLCLFLVLKTIPKGQKTISKTLWSEGYYFFIHDISHILLAILVPLIIGKILSVRAVGLYFAMQVLVQPLNMASQAIGYVILPRANLITKTEFKKIMQRILFFSILVLAIYVFLPMELSTVFYADKFPEAQYLLPLFAIMNVLIVMLSLPTAMIGGKVGIFFFKLNTNLNLVISLVSIALVYLLGTQLELRGILLVLIFAWAAKCMISIIIYIISEKKGIRNQS